MIIIIMCWATCHTFVVNELNVRGYKCERYSFSFITLFYYHYFLFIAAACVKNFQVCKPY